MLFCSITKGGDGCKVEKSVKSLTVNLHLSEVDFIRYSEMFDEHQRFEFYLSLLERAYAIADTAKAIPVNELLDLHQRFREENYTCSIFFKKKTINKYSIKICLNHVCTSYDYRLVLSVYNKKNNLLGEDYIFQTYPDSIFIHYNVRHLVITDSSLLITDFIDKPQIECKLTDLASGVISPIYLDDNTEKYIYSEKTKAKFDALRWDVL